MLLRRCLLHRDIVLPRNTIFSIFSLCLHLGLYMSYLCDLFYIIIFISITINNIISLLDIDKLVSWTCLPQKFSLRVLLSFCIIFCQFPPGVAYKSVTYTKSVQSDEIYQGNIKIQQKVQGLQAFAFVVTINYEYRKPEFKIKCRG